MKKIISSILILWVTQTLLFVGNVEADDKTIHIYQDADLSIHSQSSKAIQLGIEVAFAEVNNEINGNKILFKYLDHRGNVLRSKRNYKAFINDPNALVLYSGIHSPPLINNRKFINESKALTLVPWAAGAPITRYPSKENWIFRLSIDDMQAGGMIIDYAMKNQQCRKPQLLLENTPWGNSNLVNMSKALKFYDIQSPQVTRFNLSVKAKGAQVLTDSIINQGSDCIILVSNAVEGAVFANVMLEVPRSKRLPIISHWGITSGDLHEKIDAKAREGLALHFIQSCFAFTNETQTPLANQVFSQLIEHTKGTIKDPADLQSAVGFIHAYDLTKLLIQAIKQSKLTGNTLKDRNTIRLALEDLSNPVQGLIKTYDKPFSVFDSVLNNKAHEALNASDYCMGYYGAMDEIIIINE